MPPHEYHPLRPGIPGRRPVYRLRVEINEHVSGSADCPDAFRHAMIVTEFFPQFADMYVDAPVERHQRTVEISSDNVSESTAVPQFRKTFPADGIPHS